MTNSYRTGDGRGSGAFTIPWSAVQRFRLVQERPLTESLCAENNFDHFNFGVAPLPQDDNPDF